MTERERVLDLLVSRATEGLSDEETMELERGLREYPDIDPDAFDLAAAEADLALSRTTPEDEALPAGLAHRIVEQAPEHLPPRGGAEPQPGVSVPFADRKPRRTGAGMLGWYAAAAMLVLSIVGFWSWRPSPPGAGPTVAEQRAALLEESADVIRVAWTPPEFPDYAGVSGDVVWSNQRQTGFMRLRGMPANRSESEQYQLWIVDPSRDEHPIDGGVFDVPSGAEEVIVPIDAKLAVAAPRAFAITLEKPGGVVVSDGPLLVVAPVGA